MPRRWLLDVGLMLAVALARLPVALVHLDTWAVYEVHSGSIAQGLLDGLDLDIARLPIFVHVRGGSLLGFLIAPFYALFGTSALVMKLVALLWHVATVGLLVYALDRFFDRRTALTAGLLFLFAPPMMAKLSVIGCGSHMESSLFLALALIPFLAITVEKRTSPGLYFAFGLATGLAHTWHLQALLQCLLLAALLVLQGPRRLIGLSGLALLAGAALGAAPSSLFTGLGTLDSTWDVVSYYLNPDHTAPVEGLATSAPWQYGQDTFARKLGSLFGGGFIHMLEFQDVGPDLGPALGIAWALLLVGAAGWAIVQDRARMLAVFRRLLGARDAEPSPALFFPLHIALLVCLHLWSPLTSIELAHVSSGAGNRRFAPLLTSLMILAALGMAGGLRRPTPRRLWLALLVPACLVGAVGFFGAARATEANQLTTRGECYEWFAAQLRHDAGGDPARMIDTIRRIDQGDARFRSLRFRLPMKQVDVDDPNVLEREQRLARKSSPEFAVYRATALGRALSEEPVRLLESSRWALVEASPQPLRDAMLHGIGLSLPATGPGQPEEWEATIAVLRVLCERLPPARAEGIAEGAGFNRGLTLDVYTEQVEFIDAFECLPEHARAAYYRGLGWGFRQRYLHPPDHLPGGLSVLDHLPPGSVEDFADGYLARRLPAEAAVMKSATDV